MTGQATLGDFLAAARRDLDQSAATAGHQVTAAPGKDAAEIVGGLRTLVSVLSRHAADVVAAFGAMPYRNSKAAGAWPWAALEVHDALTAAAVCLGRPDPGDAQPPACRPARHLHAAALALAAGRDLLHTHFDPGPANTRPGRSQWAPVIASPALNRALLAEVTALAARAAPVCAAIPPSASRTSYQLSQASQWLSVAAACTKSASQAQPVPAADRDLLHAIPAAALPARRVPDGTEPVSALCDGIITTATRASHAAWTAAMLPSGSPAISVTSWRRIAAAGTATSHHCHVLLTALATRAASHGHTTLSTQLAEAAADAWLARSAWLRTARSLSQVTTEIRWQTSRAAADAADLALWTGRLAYADSAWTLASGPNQPGRPPEALAPAPGDLPQALAAVHHAADAVARLGAANLAQTRAAADANRLLDATKVLAEEPGATWPFTPASADLTRTVLYAGTSATRTSTSTVSAVASIAVAIRAPSRILTAAADATRTRPAEQRARPGASADRDNRPTPDPVTGEPPEPGPVEARLRDLSVTAPRMPWRATAIDHLSQQVFTDATENRRSSTRSAADIPTSSPSTHAANSLGSGKSRVRAAEPVMIEMLEVEAEP